MDGDAFNQGIGNGKGKKTGGKGDKKGEKSKEKGFQSILTPF
jgi:hypothetical protein